MSFSYQTFVGNGVSTAFNFTFSYISSSHVVVTVNGVAVSATIAGSVATCAVAPASLAAVEVRRTTPRTARLIDWEDGSVYSAADHDLADTQMLYMIQEALDSATDAVGGGVDASFLSGPLGSRPAAGTDNLYYFATDSKALYRDNATSWVLVMPALTGDVTTTGGAVATTIATDAITTAKIADLAVTTAKLAANAVTNNQLALRPATCFMGNSAGSPANVEDMTASQAAGILPAASTAASGLVELATGAEVQTGTDAGRPIVPNVAQYHLSACKAYAKFDAAAGSSTVYNVSALTDNGVGDWTVTFTTAFASAEYTVVCGAYAATGAANAFVVGPKSANPPTTTACRIQAVANDSTAAGDPTRIYFAAFGSI